MELRPKQFRVISADQGHVYVIPAHCAAAIVLDPPGDIVLENDALLRWCIHNRDLVTTGLVERIIHDVGTHQAGVRTSTAAPIAISILAGIYNVVLHDNVMR